MLTASWTNPNFRTRLSHLNTAAIRIDENLISHFSLYLSYFFISVFYIPMLECQIKKIGRKIIFFGTVFALA
jgi:hypothetical protein